MFSWSQRPESNRRPTDYESVALPTELRWLSLQQGVYSKIRTLLQGFSMAVPLRKQWRRTNQETVFTLKLYDQPVVRHFQSHLFPARQDFPAEMRQHESLRAEPAGVFGDARIIQMRFISRIEKAALA